MRIQSFRAAAAALLVAAAMGLTATGAARAESVMKDCGAEWQAAKAANTTGGQTWQEFLKGCRTRHAGAAAAPATAPASAPMAPAAAPAPAPMAPASAQTYQPKPAPVPVRPTAAPTGAGQFSTESEAKYRCPSDTVVWLNTKSHIYHYPGTRSYGTTKQGAYMCEADAVAAGDRASKSRIGKKAAAQQ
jgi:hypothetical protein